MAARIETQGLQELLVLPFRAPGGKMKLFIAALLGFAGFIIPILPGIFVMGYGGFIMRRIIRDKEEAGLPEWNNLSEMFMLGLKLFGATLIYSLPLLALTGAAVLAMYVPMFWVIMNGESARGADVARMLGLQFAGMFGGMVGIGLSYLVMFILLLILPAVLGHVVAKDSFGAAFRVREWWRILRANFGGFMIALIVVGGIFAGYMLVGQALYLTMLLCILLPILGALVGAYLLVIANVLIAQAYAQGAARIAAEPAAGDLGSEGAVLP